MFFPFPFYPAVIGLLPGLLGVKKGFRKSRRGANFRMEQLEVVAGNFALSFSLNFLSIFVHISGSNKPINVGFNIGFISGIHVSYEHKYKKQKTKRAKVGNHGLIVERPGAQPFI